MYDEHDYDNYDKKLNASLWKRLLGYAIRHKKIFTLLLVTLVVSSGIDLIFPLLTRYAIDNFVASGSVSGLWVYIIVYVMVLIIQGITTFSFIHNGGKLEMRISHAIRKDGFDKLQKLSFSFYDKTPVGYLMARMVSDIGMIGDMIAWSIVDGFYAITYLLGVIITVFIMNWKLALLTVSVLPVLAIISAVFQKKILTHQRTVRKHNSRITGALNEGITGAITTKTLVREDKNEEEFHVLTGDMRRASIRSAIISAIFMPLVMLLGSCAVALVLYRGGITTIAGAISVGTLSAFISYAGNLFEPIQNLARILSELQSAQASAERVISLLDTPLEIVDSPEVEAIYGDCLNPKTENFVPIDGDVTFSHVDFSYNTGGSILTDFNLHVKRGETIALVGETGAGKSTIINLLCRFYEPTGGEILIDGVNYKERSQTWLQSNLGYVLQQPHLFSGTIRDNIMFGKRNATEEEVIRAATLAHAHDFIMQQSKGYDTEVGEGGVMLSTGQKQLISFARVLLADPSIFVLDEATSSIDTEIEQIIQAAITNVLENRTSFIVAHRLSTIKNADKILVIRHGKITESGTHAELIALRGYYYDLYTNQFREEASGKILS